MANVVEYILNLQNNLSGGIQDATAHTKQLETAIGGIKSTAMSMLSTLGVSFAIFKGAEYVHDAVESVERLHQAVAQVEQGLISTKGAAGLTFKDVEDSAKSLSSQMKYSRADLLEMQSVLITFPSVTKETFGEASEVIANMSTALGQDLKSSAIQVGKALQDPEHGITALRRVGVNFNETQTEMVKKMVATGQQAKAQAFILNELQSEFGGRAKAAFDADPLARFNKIMGSVKMEIGSAAVELLESLKPALEGTAKFIKATVDAAKNLVEWLKENKQSLETVGVAILSGATAFGVMTIAMNANAIAAAIDAAVMGGLATVIDICAASMEFLNATFIASPIGWIVLAVAGLAAGIMALVHHFGSFNNAMKDTWEMIKAFAVGVAKAYWGVNEAIVGALTLNPTLVKKGLSDTISAVKDGASQIQAIWNNKDAQEAAAKGKSLVPKETKGATGKDGKPATTAAEPKTKAQGQKNVNIHIAINGGLIHGDFKIVTNKISEGMGKVKDMVAEALTGAINDSQIIATN
ncbi:Bacteriophage lambda, GpH, tail tape measure, N-terminal [uncultured Caudovirales phage]|uniref:Bacteriophage lambda, GpH, tail tape measure, N-terminal n=1 Tax=uncultured Caudovirales phage TaxID=2100421 RepID=A0A6J5LBI7_9CAUD|nr:Bacteriophage lambda, GpH, tail tape measure, N-terminal [uncultured Caudovirales phage]